MSKHNVDSTKNLYSLVRMLDKDQSDEVSFVFLEDAEVYRNSLNLKAIKQFAENRGKTVKFEVENQAHKDYIDAVNGDYIEYNDEEIDLENTQPKKSFNMAAATGGLAGLFGFLGKAKKPLDTGLGLETPDLPSKPGASAKKKKLIRAAVIAGVLLLTITSVSWAFFWYVPTANVSINVDSKGLIKLVDVKASVSQSTVSVEDMAIPAFNVEVTETDSQTIPTTGKKQVGEFAKGKVTITNKTDKDIIIKSGTELKLISSKKDSLVYKTTKEVKVDKYTKGTNEEGEEVIAYQSKDVDVEASAFGDNYNLDDGEKFEVKGHDTDKVVAENPQDIKGGSSNEVNVVAQADLDSLKRTLDEFMKDKVKRALSQKLVAGQVMQEASIEFATVSANYTNQLDEEADNLSLEITMSGKVLAYDDDSLDTLMKEVVKTVVPESFNLDETDPEYEVAATNVSGGTEVNLQVKLTSSITPRLNEAKIKEDLSGMNIDQAQAYLNNLNDIKSFEIAISPNLPGSLLRMPQRSENIYLKVTR